MDAQTMAAVKAVRSTPSSRRAIANNQTESYLLSGMGGNADYMSFTDVNGDGKLSWGKFYSFFLCAYSSLLLIPVKLRA